jgi:hypothetical protein
MFNLIFSGIQAFNQVGMFAGALVFLAIGGLLLGNSLYWRLHAQRVTGTVVGVLPNGKVYVTVYRYTGPDGRSHEAKSDSGSSWGKGKETGRVVRLMIAPHNPELACEADSHVFDLIGIVILAPGVLLAYIALTAFPVTWMTWIMAVVLILHLGERAYRLEIVRQETLACAMAATFRLNRHGEHPTHRVVASGRRRIRAQSDNPESCDFVAGAVYNRSDRRRFVHRELCLQARNIGRSCPGRNHSLRRILGRKQFRTQLLSRRPVPDCQ